MDDDLQTSSSQRPGYASAAVLRSRVIYQTFNGEKHEVLNRSFQCSYLSDQPGNCCLAIPRNLFTVPNLLCLLTQPQFDICTLLMALHLSNLVAVYFAVA